MVKEVYNPKAVIPHAASLHQACAHCAIFPTAASRRSLGRISVPVWPDTLSGRLPVVALVGRHPTNKLIGREPVFERLAPLLTRGCPPVTTSGINPDFSGLSRTRRWVAHVLLTRSPLNASGVAPAHAALNLHVSCTPPALILSQDQTLRRKRHVVLIRPEPDPQSTCATRSHAGTRHCGAAPWAFAESRLHSSIVKMQGAGSHGKEASATHDSREISPPARESSSLSPNRRSVKRVSRL